MFRSFSRVLKIVLPSETTMRHTMQFVETQTVQLNIQFLQKINEEKLYEGLNSLQCLRVKEIKSRSSLLTSCPLSSSKQSPLLSFLSFLEDLKVSLKKTYYRRHFSRRDSRSCHRCLNPGYHKHNHKRSPSDGPKPL